MLDALIGTVTALVILSILSSVVAGVLILADEIKRRRGRR